MEQMIEAESLVKQERDYYFDNLKFVLIFLVVLGHVVEPFIKMDFFLAKYAPLNVIYAVCYSFHMPLFIFISGYFTAHASKKSWNSLANLLLMYVVFDTLYTWFILLSPQVSVFSPRFAYWYLLSLFVWRMVAPVLARFKWIIPAAFLVGLYAGLFREVTGFLNFSRTMALLPFFMMGYFFRREWIGGIKRVPRWVGAVLLIAVCILLCWLIKEGITPHRIYFYNNPYREIDLKPLEGIMCRSIAYVVAILMSLCVMNLVTEKRTWFSGMGAGTMPVFILHGFLLPFIVLPLKIFHVFYILPPIVGVLICVAISVGFMALLGNKHTVNRFNKIWGAVSRFFLKKEPEQTPNL